MEAFAVHRAGKLGEGEIVASGGEEVGPTLPNGHIVAEPDFVARFAPAHIVVAVEKAEHRHGAAGRLKRHRALVLPSRCFLATGRGWETGENGSEEKR